MPNKPVIHIGFFPTEILQDIFHLCILTFDEDVNLYDWKDEDENNPYHQTMDLGGIRKRMREERAKYTQKMFRIGSSPWAVGQACRRWRDIVLETPTLWTHIDIDITDSDADKSFERACTVLKMYLERSRDASLHIRIRYESVYDHDAGDHPVLDLLIGQSHRWYAAELWISVPEYQLLDAVNGHVPRLHALAFNIINDTRTWENPSDPPIDFFSIAPQLRSLTLNKHEDMHSFHVPWSQLTHLEFEYFDVDQLEWFQKTTKLQTCTINFADDPYAPEKESITLVHLHTLRFTCGEQMRMDLSRFNYITVPALVELEIVAPGGTIDLLDGITSLICQSQCSLKKFSISVRGGKHIAMLEILQNMPSLEYLGIHGYGMLTNDLVEHLTPPFTRQRLAPKLHTIDFTLTRPGDFEDDLLVNMIEARWARRPRGLAFNNNPPFGAVDDEIARLQNVIFTPDTCSSDLPRRCYLSPDANERLERFETEGLNVKFLYA
jgi:hypothetical protein